MSIFTKPVDKRVSVLVLLVMLAAAVGVSYLSCGEELSQLSIYIKEKLPKIFTVSSAFRKFISEQDFRDYLAKAMGQEYSYGIGAGDFRAESLMPVPAGMGKGEDGGGTAERVSGTNVQVENIDEPDVVKTDGKNIYFSRESYYWRTPFLMESSDKSIMPPMETPKTQVINAFPPADLENISTIDKTGNLLLSKNTLAIFTNEGVFGYDVSDPKNPQKKWEAEYGENSALVSARLYQDKIYLITRSYVSESRLCPIEIMKVGGVSLSVRCFDIYHPQEIIPTDSVFTALILDGQTGKAEKTVSFVGSSGTTTVYMSETSLFAAYSYYEDTAKFILGFFKEKARDLFPVNLIAKIEKLAGYDLNQQTKITELQYLLGDYWNSLNQDDRLKAENELTNRFSDYLKLHQRELEKTGLVKIGLDDFRVAANGSVPGHLLNQFSIDEYDGNLRVAITAGERWWGWGLFSSADQSVNDVYVLDSNLKTIGSIKDLGLGERIYSARFIGEKGYLVTFKETDPFYVLNLSNPRNPVMAGELKIPGYSAYLHPISDGLILGIGRENWQVKISLFDVSNPAKPLEAGKYILNESWSDILNTHHAFLLDAKHKIFFLPGSQGGYVFSYENNGLEMKKAASGIAAKRAIYLNDYLYIIGDDKIIVFNELDWQKVSELEL